MNQETFVKNLYFNEKPHRSGKLLTEEDVKEKFASGKRFTLTAHNFTTDDEKEIEFYSNNHLFGYLTLPDDVCPISMQMPMEVTPRPGVENGIVDSFEKYKIVFGNNTTQVFDLNTLYDIFKNICVID